MFSWLLSAVLFVLGIMIIYHNKRLTSEMIGVWHSDWGRLVDIDRFSKSRFYIGLFRRGFIFVGIVIILIAIRILFDSLST
jgi:hypothetical protein